ncbi:hypothetical protein ACFWPQ_01570 [Streptomyces sp. NPDC058464]|uniref:hypothetical protein n=1 Tax=Streptomyces sp. NPDC058464 TaxID=3346511 RepID=UPI0036513363
MPNQPAWPLGKAPAQPARPQLRLSPVLDDANLPAPPETCDWQDDRIVWPMYGNADWGDCVWAEIGHEINQLTYYATGDEAQPTDADILKGYSDVTGFDPNAGTPGENSTDNGTYVQDAMKYWRKTGVGGHKIIAYASIDPSNLDHVRLAISLFGSVSIGIQFPDSAMRQFNAGQIWDVVRGAKNEGGHCILGGAYDKEGIGLVTWGAETKMTWRFFTKYADEVWVPLDEDGLNKAGQYFTGVATFYALGGQFAALTGETNPVPAPQPTPTPVPSPPSPPAPSPAPDLDPRLVQVAQLMSEWAHDNNVTGA